MGNFFRRKLREDKRLHKPKSAIENQNKKTYTDIDLKQPLTQERISPCTIIVIPSIAFSRPMC